MGLNLVWKAAAYNQIEIQQLERANFQHKNITNIQILLVSSTSRFYELHNKSYELVHIIKQ